MNADPWGSVSTALGGTRGREAKAQGSGDGAQGRGDWPIPTQPLVILSAARFKKSIIQ